MDVQDLTRSYGRCTLSPSFFDDFYEELMQSSPDIKNKFTGLDMAKQKSLLKEGISFLLMLNKGSDVAKRKISALAGTHSKDHQNIEPWMYDHWKASLLKTVKAHDPKIDDALLESWDLALQGGIKMLIEKYS